MEKYKNNRGKKKAVTERLVHNNHHDEHEITADLSEGIKTDQVKSANGSPTFSTKYICAVLYIDVYRYVNVRAIATSHHCM